MVEPIVKEPEESPEEAGQDSPTLDEVREENRPSVLHRVANRFTGTVVDYISPDLILSQVDVNALLDRIDVNALLDRVDVNALLDRVDVDRVMARVDVEELVQRAGIADIVAETTGAFAETGIDYVRRQAAAVDTVIYYGIQRLLGRRREELPTGPPRLTTR